MSVRRRWSRLLLSSLLACTVSWPATASAQTNPSPGSSAYPAKGSTIRIVVPFGAGSGTDMMTRILVEDVQKSLPDANLIVDNKPGANGAIAAEAVSKAAPDGYTLLLVTSSAFSANPWLMKKINYDPVRDFTPIARTTNFPFFLGVAASSPYKTVDDLIQRAKSGARVTMGYGNATGQVANAHLMKVAQFEATSVPYKSTPPAMVDLIGGQIDAVFLDLASSQAMVREGKIRPIAMMADRRSELMPGLPALGEKFPGFSYIAWGGLVGPAGLNPAVVEKMGALFNGALAKPEVARKYTTLGLETYPGSAAEFAKFIVEQRTAWGAKIKDAAMEPE